MQWTRAQLGCLQETFNEEVEEVEVNLRRKEAKETKKPHGKINSCAGHSEAVEYRKTSYYTSTLETSSSYEEDFFVGSFLCGK